MVRSRGDIRKQGECPYLESDDGRCAGRFGLTTMAQAIDLCLGRYTECGVYHQIRSEHHRESIVLTIAGRPIEHERLVAREAHSQANLETDLETNLEADAETDAKTASQAVVFGPPRPSRVHVLARFVPRPLARWLRPTGT